MSARSSILSLIIVFSLGNAGLFASDDSRELGAGQSQQIRGPRPFDCDGSFAKASRSKTSRLTTAVLGLGILSIWGAASTPTITKLIQEGFYPQDHVTDGIDIELPNAPSKPSLAKPSIIDVLASPQQNPLATTKILQLSRAALDAEQAFNGPGTEESEKTTEVRPHVKELLEMLRQHESYTEDQIHLILDGLLRVLEHDFNLDPSSGEGEVLRALLFKAYILRELGPIAAEYYQLSQSTRTELLGLSERMKQILLYALPAVNKENGRFGESYQIGIRGLMEWHRFGDGERIRKELEYEDFRVPWMMDGLSTEPTRLAALESLAELVKVDALEPAEVKAIISLAEEMDKALSEHLAYKNYHDRSEHYETVREVRGADITPARLWMDQRQWVQKRATWSLRALRKLQNASK